MTRLLLALACSAVFPCLPAAAEPCRGKGVEVQVLGSGGPEVQGRRASSSYLVWRDGAALVLVDAGGGSALRFGEAGATMTGLRAILLTHLHADHAADLPALVKSSFFERRTAPLPVLGPAAGRFFPSTTAFVKALFDEHAGAFRYLSDYLPGGDGGYELQARDVAVPAGALAQVLDLDGVKVFAARAVHGVVPALSYRIEVAGVAVAFSGDFNGEGGGIEKAADHADLWVAHNAVPEGAAGVERRLHAPPSEIGRIAAAAHVKRLVLSHRMMRTLGKEAATRAAIEAPYGGAVGFADDLDCYAIAARTSP